MTTPVALRAAMVFVCIPAVLLALTIHLGVSRNRDAVRTVGTSATRGITAAQRIKANLSELDLIAVVGVLKNAPTGVSGLPDDYNQKRSELERNLVSAAAESSSGPAFVQPLANINYALAHYHGLVKESFAARRVGTKAASAVYARAHDVMANTLLAQADAFDKANTYILNATYVRHRSNASSTIGLLLLSMLLLMAVLVVVQVVLARKFRRVVNVGLAVAMVVGFMLGVFAIAKFNAASHQLAVARERAFDSVHELARARSTVTAARQSQAQLLLDPSLAASTQASFDSQAARIFRLNGLVTPEVVPDSGHVTEVAGGYLAKVITADVSSQGTASAARALSAFRTFLVSDRALRASASSPAGLAEFERAEAFNGVVNALASTQSIDQRTFDTHARAAARAISRLDAWNVLVTSAVLALALAGLYARLREYR